MIQTLRNRLRILVYVGAAALFVVSLFDNGPAAGISLSRLSIVEAFLLAVITVFDRYVWRWWKVPEIARTGPVLRGTWKGVARPTGKGKPSVAAYLSIRQSFSGIAFRLMTEESASDSSSAQLTLHADGLSVAEYFFENIPRDAVRERSEIHFGAAQIHCVGARPDRLEGTYFTSRRTSGELEFTEHNSEVTHSFTDASKLDYT